MVIKYFQVLLLLIKRAQQFSHLVLMATRLP